VLLQGCAGYGHVVSSHHGCHDAAGVAETECRECLRTGTCANGWCGKRTTQCLTNNCLASYVARPVHASSETTIRPVLAGAGHLATRRPCGIRSGGPAVRPPVSVSSSSLDRRLCPLAVLQHLPQQLAGAGLRDMAHELDLARRLVDRHPATGPVD